MPKRPSRPSTEVRHGPVVQHPVREQKPQRISVSLVSPSLGRLIDAPIRFEAIDDIGSNTFIIKPDALCKQATVPLSLPTSIIEVIVPV